MSGRLWSFLEYSVRSFGSTNKTATKQNGRDSHNCPRACFGSAVDTIHDLRSGSPESLAARAFAGFRRVSKPGLKTALTTGLTTDRKNFDFRPQRGIIAKTEYPGVAELVPRHIWDVEIARSNRVTRTKNPLKSMMNRSSKNGQ